MAHDVPKKLSTCIDFEYRETELATKAFDSRKVSEGGRKLGEGRFGPVFLGNLCNTEVAIKVLRRPMVSERGSSRLV